MNTNSRGLDNFFKSFPKYSYKKGEIILRPDDTPSHLYYLTQGHVKVYALAEWGEELLYVIYRPGEFFPIIWMLQSSPLTGYFEAMDKVVIHRVPKEDLVKHLATNNEQAMNFADYLIDIMNIYRHRIENLMYTKASIRLISRLIYLADRFGSKVGSGMLIDAPITHKDIATSISMTRETVSREFEKLVKKGILSYRGKSIFIKDVKKLLNELKDHKLKDSL